MCRLPNVQGKPHARTRTDVESPENVQVASESRVGLTDLLGDCSVAVQSKTFRTPNDFNSPTDHQTAVVCLVSPSEATDDQFAGRRSDGIVSH